MTVQRPDEPLWEARRALKLADEQPTRHILIDLSCDNLNLEERKKDDDEDSIHLLPEFVYVLPMPLDLLFLVSELIDSWYASTRA
jgi:hypothetical protein